MEKMDEVEGSIKDEGCNFQILKVVLVVVVSSIVLSIYDLLND